MHVAQQLYAGTIDAVRSTECMTNLHHAYAHSPISYQLQRRTTFLAVRVLVSRRTCELCALHVAQPFYAGTMDAVSSKG